MHLELQTTRFFLWLFQLDDSKSLHQKCREIFHQTSMKKNGCLGYKRQGWKFGNSSSLLKPKNPWILQHEFLRPRFSTGLNQSKSDAFRNRPSVFFFFGFYAPHRRHWSPEKEGLDSGWDWWWPLGRLRFSRSFFSLNHWSDMKPKMMSPFFSSEGIPLNLFHHRLSSYTYQQPWVWLLWAVSTCFKHHKSGKGCLGCLVSQGTLKQKSGTKNLHTVDGRNPANQLIW